MGGLLKDAMECTVLTIAGQNMMHFGELLSVVTATVTHNTEPNTQAMEHHDFRYSTVSGGDKGFIPNILTRKYDAPPICDVRQESVEHK